MEKLNHKNLKYWLRWIAVLPGAFIGGLLATFPFHLLLYWITYSASANHETFFGLIEVTPELGEYIEYIFYPSVMTITFVYVGYKIAPKYKFKTAIVLFSLYFFIWTTIGIISLTKGVILGGGIQFSVRTILALVGAIIGLYLAKKDNDEVKN